MSLEVIKENMKCKVCIKQIYSPYYNEAALVPNKVRMNHSHGSNTPVTFRRCMCGSLGGHGSAHLQEYSHAVLV